MTAQDDTFDDSIVTAELDAADTTLTAEQLQRLVGLADRDRDDWAYVADEGDGRFTGEVAAGHLDHDAEVEATATTYPVDDLEAVPLSITADTADGHSVTATSALTAKQAEALAADLLRRANQLRARPAEKQLADARE